MTLEKMIDSRIEEMREDFNLLHHALSTISTRADEEAMTAIGISWPTSFRTDITTLSAVCQMAELTFPEKTRIAELQIEIDGLDKSVVDIASTFPDKNTQPPVDIKQHFYDEYRRLAAELEKEVNPGGFA